MFNYSLQIGEYSDPVRLSIDAKVKGGLSATDYERARELLNELESIFVQYDQLEKEIAELAIANQDPSK